MKPNLKPPNAITIWLSGNDIVAQLPGQGELSHTLTVPATTLGMKKLLKLLANRTPLSRIGESGDLTQYQLDRMVLEFKAKQKSEFTQDQRDKATAVLKRLGMI